MGWHVGMSYEEMQKEFASGASKEAGGEEAGSIVAKEDEDTTTTATACESQGSSAQSAPTACPLPKTANKSHPPAPPKDHPHVYHLCRRADWDEATASQTPYFPRTFMSDGKFTRASLFLEDIVDVANEYYQTQSPPTEDWIILEIDVQYLYSLGNPVLAAIAPESVNSAGDPTVQCLQILGGISTHPDVLPGLITSVFPVKRRPEDGKFIGMLQSELAPDPDETDDPAADNEDGGKNDDPDEATVDEILEIPTDDSHDEREASKTNKTRKSPPKPKSKKNRFFSKLKVKKSSAPSPSSAAEV